MDHLTYARAQMGFSLAFHMLFAAVGVALPLFMVIADVLYRRTGDRDWLEFSKRMAKGTAILFAVGAVSGTVLSFELGLLWPNFMGTFGDVIGRWYHDSIHDVVGDIQQARSRQAGRRSWSQWTCSMGTAPAA